ncbi:MAG: HD-GYP domain-containing protein, partial [Methylophilaceae bacterium]
IFQNEEKAKRAAELVIANKELIFQNEEKAKRAAELVIANKELIFQNEEKAKRAAELVIAKLKVVHNEKLHILLMETIDLVRKLVELRDPYTSGHEKRVGDLAKAIGTGMGFDANHQEALMIAGYLHDLGKIAVPVEILVKPGKLSKQEFELIKNHVLAGYNLLKDITFPWKIARTVLEHHERLDGSGYPNGIKAEEISIDGRILAVADVVEAMSSFRPYRATLGIERALTEIERGRGSLYDENVVDVCLKLFHEEGYELNSSLL